MTAGVMALVGIVLAAGVLMWAGAFMQWRGRDSALRRHPSAARIVTCPVCGHDTLGPAREHVCDPS